MRLEMGCRSMEIALEVTGRPASTANLHGNYTAVGSPPGWFIFNLATTVHSSSQNPEEAVTQDRRHLSWALAIFFVCFVAWGTLRADDPSGASHLTVGRLFGTKEFDTESLPARRWSKRTATYFTIEKSAGGGSEVVRNDPATGKKEVVVPGTVFVPKDAKKPLAIESFEFSDDESRVLVFTNSQRVWRRNTRGDYWVLDVMTRKLSKLGGDAAPSSLMFPP